MTESKNIPLDRVVEVQTADGHAYRLSFRAPSLFRLRHLKGRCFTESGEFVGERWDQCLFDEAVDLLREVEGAALVLAGDDGAEVKVDSSLDRESIRRIREFHQKSRMAFDPKHGGWKGIFVNCFLPVFQSAKDALWAREMEGAQRLKK